MNRFYGRAVPAKAYRGISMLEFMVALFVFTLGLTGVRSAQLVAGKTNAEALQFTEASLAANRMLTRIQRNAGQLPTYLALGASWRGHIDEVRSAPACEATTCAPDQLARDDIDAWHRELAGKSAQAETPTGGLPGVYACIVSRGAGVLLETGWRSSWGAPNSAPPDCPSDEATPVGPREAFSADAWNVVRVRSLVPRA